ncbi:UDP-N-acetylmuramoyl-L-alanyl-D-glutamate--2, 6-diaminopimelate ligase [cyanobiont of Ornithocercus magnificus]|nr:UDP-N-acetylmuramoyl-L-alanyl-D-glutamate--2, 6-diaminopimelate ligase [cyanobiont of Ornithocercus magnificus]
MNAMLHDLMRDVGLVVPTNLINPHITQITCNSHKVELGSLFLGLPGERTDGGYFWSQALAAGAAAAMISPAAAAETPPSATDPVIILPEPVSSYIGRLAAAFYHNPSSHLALIGVTGTNGKTTVAHLIEYLCMFAGYPTALFGTLVNRWPGNNSVSTYTTSPADLLQNNLAKAVCAGAQLAAMEVSSHALVQQRVAGCKFSGAIFTNLTQDHLDYHQSMESYFEAKASLFTMPFLDLREAQAVVNTDDTWGQKLSERLGTRAWRCSLNEGAVARGEADLGLGDLKFGSGSVRGNILTPKGTGSFYSHLIGRFNLMNLLQAVGILLQRQLPLPLLLKAIPAFHGVPGRMERIIACNELASQPTVLIDYAHTPDALEKALQASRLLCKGRLICVFGCGGERDLSKRPQMGAIAAQIADQLVVTSDNPRTENPQHIIDDIVAGMPTGRLPVLETNRATAIATAIEMATPDDLVLIAGKGHETYQILGNTRVHFDDREQAAAALRHCSQ